MVVKRIVSLFRTTPVKIALLVVLFLTSVLIALAMLLGREAGTFVIRVKDTTKTSIGITTGDPLTSQKETRLSAPAAMKMDCASPAYFISAKGYDRLNEIQANNPGVFYGTGSLDNSTTELSKNSEGLCCFYVYTFYIVNTGETPAGFDVRMTYNGATQGLENAIRIMTYAKDENTQDPRIYWNPDTETTYPDGSEVRYRGYSFAPTPIAFTNLSDSGDSGDVFSKEHYTLNVDDYMAYSIYMWIEGDDPEATDALHGAVINFEMEITVSM